MFLADATAGSNVICLLVLENRVNVLPASAGRSAVLSARRKQRAEFWGCSAFPVMCLACRAGQRSSPEGTSLPAAERISAARQAGVSTLGLQSEGKPSPQGTKESRRDHLPLSSLTGRDGGGVCSQRPWPGHERALLYPARPGRSKSVTVQWESLLTLILSPLRAGRGKRLGTVQKPLRILRHPHPHPGSLIGWEREKRRSSVGVISRFESCERRGWLFPLPSDGRGSG